MGPPLLPCHSRPTPSRPLGVSHGRVAVPCRGQSMPCMREPMPRTNAAREPMPRTYEVMRISWPVPNYALHRVDLSPINCGRVSGHLFVFVFVLLWLPCLSFLMSYLCTIETNGTGFLGYCANPCGLQHGLINTNEPHHVHTNGLCLPMLSPMQGTPMARGFFFSFAPYIVCLEFTNNQELSTPQNVIHYIHRVHSYGELVHCCSARQLSHALM